MVCKPAQAMRYSRVNFALLKFSLTKKNYKQPVKDNVFHIAKTFIKSIQLFIKVKGNRDNKQLSYIAISNKLLVNKTRNGFFYKQE